MTFRDLAVQHLIEVGMDPSSAIGIQSTAELATEEQYRSVWTKDIDEYPTHLRPLFLERTNQAAVAWIDANQPDHWTRGIFVGTKMPKPIIPDDIGLPKHNEQ